MNTAFNPARQNYVKYDDNHYLLFLNEQEAEQTNENGDKVKGYTYTGRYCYNYSFGCSNV